MKTSKIDLFALNPVDDISYVQDIVNVSSTKKIYKEHILQLIHSFFSRSSISRRSILFYGVTANNQRTLAPIIKNVKSDFINISNDKDFYISRYMLISAFFVFPLLKCYLKANKTNRRKIRKGFVKYLLTYGKYYVAGKLLDKVQPRLLVLTNDHTNMNRCLLSQAKEKGIKTLYVQHASVSSQFPPLDFDYSFLDGEKQFELYGNYSKPNSIVVLSGPCRYDYMSEYLNKSKQYIGISLNEFDDFEKVKQLCNYLKSIKVENIKVRPHPSMGEWNKTWFDNNNIGFSTPSIETPGEYLSTLKLQISNTSGIHLDSTLLHVPTIHYCLSKSEQNDIFGFISEGLVTDIKDFEHIGRVVMNPSEALPNDIIVRRFVSSYNTSIEFHVGCFISKCCDLIVLGKENLMCELFIEHKITYYKF